jgi:hypothetical protein
MGIVESEKSKMEYSVEENEISYVYQPKATQGKIQLWPLSHFSKFNEIVYTEHADERLAERGFTKDDLVDFFNSNTIKVVWRPNYKSATGLDARVTGNLKGKGLITVYISDDFVENDNLVVFSAHPINHGKEDIKLYNEGLELLSRIIERQEEDGE